MARRKITESVLPLFAEQETEAAPPARAVATALVPDVPAPTALKWSHSKRGILTQCARQFYYQYYGANRGVAKDEPNKAELKRLKMISNRHERTGQILHFVIAYYLREAQEERVHTTDGMVAWARRAFQKDISLSLQGFDNVTLSTEERAPHFLMEFLHEPDARVLCREAEEEMVAALTAFLESARFRELRELGMRAGALVEKNFHRLPDVPFGVRGQVDLAHREEGGGVVTIVDWKSGEDTGAGDDSLQLAVYALWARDFFDCDAGEIQLYKAFLGADEIVPFPVTDRTLRSARLRMIQDSELFLRMHEYGCAGVAEAFTPCAQEAVCRGCAFVAVCPEGKESIA
jgi:hypothetical protein